VIYFLSFIMNQRYKHLGMLELVTFVICSNGIFDPYFSFVVILWTLLIDRPINQDCGSFCLYSGSMHQWI
jgi:hypothetical protein